MNGYKRPNNRAAQLSEWLELDTWTQVYSHNRQQSLWGVFLRLKGVFSRTFNVWKGGMPEQDFVRQKWPRREDLSRSCYATRTICTHVKQQSTGQDNYTQKLFSSISESFCGSHRELTNCEGKFYHGRVWVWTLSKQEKAINEGYALITINLTKQTWRPASVPIGTSICCLHRLFWDHAVKPNFDLWYCSPRDNVWVVSAIALR